jgi:hypothetical protein
MYQLFLVNHCTIAQAKVNGIAFRPWCKRTGLMQEELLEANEEKTKYNNSSMI